MNQYLANKVNRLSLCGALLFFIPNAHAFQNAKVVCTPTGLEQRKTGLEHIRWTASLGTTGSVASLFSDPRWKEKKDVALIAVGVGAAFAMLPAILSGGNPCEIEEDTSAFTGRIIRLPDLTDAQAESYRAATLKAQWSALYISSGYSAALALLPEKTPARLGSLAFAIAPLGFALYREHSVRSERERNSNVTWNLVPEVFVTSDSGDGIPGASLLISF